MSSVPQYLGQSSGNNTPSWLTAAQQWYNSGNLGSGSYKDSASGMQIMPMFNTTYGGNGQDRTTNNQLIGWRASKGNVGDEFTGYDLNGNPIDPTQGGLYGSTVADTSDTFLDKLIQGGVLAGAGYGAGSLMGLWGGAGATGAGAATGVPTAAGTGGGSSSLYSLGGGSSGGLGLTAPSGALGTAATTGLEAGTAGAWTGGGLTPAGNALTGTLGNSLGMGAGTAAVTGAVGAGNAGQGLSVIPGVGTNLITETGSGLGLNPSPAVVPGSNIGSTIPTNPLGNLGPGVSLGTGSGINIPGVSTTKPGSTSSGGLDLGSIIAGLLSGYQQNQNSKDILGYLDKQQADIDKLYAPGSPEYEYLMKGIERKDAASGRNSQYGPRSVELGAKIAQIKAEQKARLAIGGSQFAVPAIQQGNSTLNGLLAALGGANSAGYTIPQVVQNVSSIINGLFGDK